MRKTTKEYNDSYYEGHREEILARIASYRQKHLEEMRARKNELRAASPEKFREYARAYRAENKERVNALARVRRAENPEKTRAANQRFKEKWRARRVEIAARPRPDECEVCGRAPDADFPSGRVLHWDHDHETGEFRGWICKGCNSALGYVQDNPATLRALADYLDRFVASQGLPPNSVEGTV